MATHISTDSSLPGDLSAAHLAGAIAHSDVDSGAGAEPKPFLCRRPVRIAIYTFFALL
jgi:hypothetical protein